MKVKEITAAAAAVAAARTRLGVAADGPDLLDRRLRLFQTQGGQVKLVADVCLQLLVELLFTLL